MTCGRPSGDPQAIADAARAIERYASGIDVIFGAIDRSGGLEPLWRGDSAEQAAQQLGGYRFQLDGYADQLREYAAQLSQYAESLAEQQRCSIWDILTWVFLIVFSIIELVFGLFFGGVLEGAFTMLFGSLTEYAVDTINGLLMVVDETLDSVGTLARFGEDALEFGARVGNVLGDSGEISDALTTTVRLGGFDTERVIVEAQKQVTAALMKTADNVVQEFIIRGVSSLDPQNGGGSGTSAEADAETAATIFTSALLGGVAGKLTMKLIDLSPGLLTDVFSDVVKDVWTNVSLESITAEVNGKPFDAQDLWYRTVWGLGKALVKAPGKKFAGSVTGRFVTVPPGAGRSPLAKELGDLPINDGFGVARKATSDLVGGSN